MKLQAADEFTLQTYETCAGVCVKLKREHVSEDYSTAGAI